MTGHDVPQNSKMSKLQLRKNNVRRDLLLILLIIQGSQMLTVPNSRQAGIRLSVRAYGGAEINDASIQCQVLYGMVGTEIGPSTSVKYIWDY